MSIQFPRARSFFSFRISSPAKGSRVYSPSIREAIWGVYRRASSPGVRFVLMMVERRLQLAGVDDLVQGALNEGCGHLRSQIVQNQQIAVQHPLHVGRSASSSRPNFCGLEPLRRCGPRYRTPRNSPLLADLPGNGGGEVGLSQSRMCRRAAGSPAVLPELVGIAPRRCRRSAPCASGRETPMFRVVRDPEYQSVEKVSKLWPPRSSIRDSSFCCSRA